MKPGGVYNAARMWRRLVDAFRVLPHVQLHSKRWGEFDAVGEKVPQTRADFAAEVFAWTSCHMGAGAYASPERKFILTAARMRAAGHSNHDIARYLGVSESTLKRRRNEVCARLAAQVSLHNCRIYKE